MAKQATDTPLLYVRQDLGEGRPLVLLHGMFGDGTQWRVVADRLSKYYRVIVVDLLGHGLSPRPARARYTGREHVRALRKTLEKLGATQDTTVVGYSMGGAVALQYAADYHDVAQLYLISAPFYLKPEDMVASGYANSLLYTKVSIGLFHLVEKRLHPGTLLYKMVGNEDMMQWLHVLIDAYDNKLDPDVMRMNLRELITDYPFMSNLKKVRAPITFYAGKRDVFVVQPQLRALKKIQPLMEIETLGLVKNDHAVVQYLPRQIVRFLRRYHDNELHIEKDVGQGRTLVLLHGIESSATYWSNIVPALAEHRRVVTVDLLGFGKSPKPLNVAYSLDDQVAWLRRTLRARGIKSFDLAGHSLGALVAMAYAAAYPSDVKALTLIAPVFVDTSGKGGRFITKRLNVIEYFSDTSYLVSSVSKMVGYERIRRYIPTIRSITNAIKVQHPIALARKLKPGKTMFMYSDDDPLVDAAQVQKVAKAVKGARTVVLQGGSHNISLSDPEAFLEAFEPRVRHKTPVKSSNLKPGQFVRQLLRLASPILLIKALLYIAVGLLLFSRYNQQTLIAIVAAFVTYQGIQFIRGSFSLKNENLSYVGYGLIGVFAIALGWALTNHFGFTLRVALYVLCGLVLFNGISRLLAGIFWTSNKALRRAQLLSGATLTIVALAAFLGSLASVKIIVYTLAGIAVVRGLTVLSYLAVAFFVAYVRGYQ